MTPTHRVLTPRARVWKGANGGWICHEWLLIDLGDGDPFWVGGRMRWAPDWPTALGWAVGQ